MIIRHAGIVLALATIPFGLPACGTLLDTFSVIEDDDIAGPRIYGGLRFDIATTGSDKGGALLTVMAVLDLPLSIGLDTALLPASLINELVIH